MGWTNPPAAPAGAQNVNVINSPTVGLASGASVGLAAGAQLTAASGLALQATGDQLLSGDLGTGADGAVTISANATLTSDKNYATLTVNAGAKLTSAGYVIRCTGTVTVNGTIDNSGTNATGTFNNMTSGVGGAAGTLAGGAAGVQIASGHIAGVNPPPADIEGGPGGSAFYGTVTNLAAGGSVTTAGSLWLSVAGLRSFKLGGGASGGAQNGSVTSGAEAASGGGGGAVLIVCAALAGSGTISANAGNPLLSATDVNVSAGGAGGGTVAVATRSASGWTGHVTANGSAGAANSGGTGNPGGPGRAGLLVTTS